MSLNRKRTRADLAAWKCLVFEVFWLFPIDGRLSVDLDGDMATDNLDVSLVPFIIFDFDLFDILYTVEAACLDLVTV